MKITLIAYFGLACVCLAGSDSDAVLRKQLREAAESDGPEHVAIRDRIVADTSTNELYRASSDPALDWKDRLVARIALERKLRGADIEALRRYAWRKDPEARRPRESSVAGPAVDDAVMVKRRMNAAGLWYYYAEINWKDTGDQVFSNGPRFEVSWPWFAARASWTEPEKWYMAHVLVERIGARKEPMDADMADRYRARVIAKDADAIPVLVAKYELFFRAAVPEYECYPGENNAIYRTKFASIMSFADVRHIALLEKYISEHPVLEPLRPKLEEVKKRPAPEPVPEPPFRVMPTPEFLKIGPFVTEHPS